MSANTPPPAATGDPMVDQYLAGVGMADGGEPIGGYFAGTGGVNPDTGGQYGTGPLDPLTGEFVGPYAQTTPHGIASGYSKGDETVVWEGLTLEDRTRLQDQLVSFGLAKSVIPGEFDDGTMNGITSLLGLSNRAGTHWRGTLGRLQSLQDRGLLDKAGSEKAEFDTPTYLAPDYATLAQNVKSMFRQTLGRDPDQSEMANLTAELEGWHKGAFDAQVGAQRQDFDNRQADGEQAGGTVRQVDPLARFQEAFESRYANEIDFVEDKAEAVETRENIEQGVGTLSQMSTGV